MGPLSSLLCPGGGILYTVIVHGRGFLPPSSPVQGGLSQGVVLDETDSCINRVLFCFLKTLLCFYLTLCTIKILGGRGGDTFKTPSPVNNFCLYPPLF